MECYSDIKICGEGGGAARRWSSCGSSAPRAAVTRSWFRGSPRSGREQILKYVQTDWNRLRVCRSALVETWPMLGLNLITSLCTLIITRFFRAAATTGFRLYVVPLDIAAVHSLPLLSVPGKGLQDLTIGHLHQIMSSSLES